MESQLCVIRPFVCDAYKKNGNDYLPKSVFYLVFGFLRYLRDKKRHDIYFFSHLRLTGFKKKLYNAKIKSLLFKGLGIELKQADPIIPIFPGDKALL